MKFILIIFLVFVGIWLWRSTRPSALRSEKQTQTSAQAHEMVRCAHCAVHIPLADAVQGKKGLYCSDDHRALLEG
jgi:uncharacterized protein